MQRNIDWDLSFQKRKQYGISALYTETVVLPWKNEIMKNT